MTQSLLADNLDDPTQIDPNKNYLQELVGEGKKFKTPEDLARGKFEADTYIPILEKRLDEMRKDYLKLNEDYTARAKLEELVDQLSKQQQLASSETPHAKEVNEQPVIDPKDIENRVLSRIEAQEVSKREIQNENLVRAKLQEQYGNNFAATVKKQIGELGLTEEDFNALARRSPGALFRTLGLEQPEQRDSFQPPLKSSQRSDTFAPRVQKRTWAFYQQMKKDNPKLYNDPKTTVQMHNDAIALGDEFQDGDWHLA